MQKVKENLKTIVHNQDNPAQIINLEEIKKMDDKDEKEEKNVQDEKNKKDVVEDIKKEKIEKIQIKKNHIKREIVYLRGVPKKSNMFVFKLLPDNREFTRKLSDINWLRSNLMAEFPFYYIPPVKAVDFKENFIQNFFYRIMNSSYIDESETMKVFLNDAEFSKIKANEISSIDKVMDDKMRDTFSKNDMKKQFESNEKVYDDILTKYFLGFDNNKNNHNYFNEIFKNLNIYCINNSKLFSQLKHLSYDLCDLLNKTSTVIHKIAGVYNKFINESNDLYNKIKFKRDDQVDLIHKKLKVGLYEWGSQLLSQKKFVIDHLAGFYHYKKHEYTSFSKLINLKIEGNSKFTYNVDLLTKKKMKLFNSKDITTWGMDKEKINGVNINEIFQDFENARKIMLPKETNDLKQEMFLNTFLNKHVLFEYLNFYIISQFYIEENFHNFTEKMMNSFRKEDLMWNIFNTNNVDISNLDRESTFTLKSKIQMKSKK